MIFGESYGIILLYVQVQLEGEMKMVVSVCIGSSCHLKGSYDIITTFKDLIAQHKLEDKVELAAAFCLGHCIDGVTIKVDEELVTGVNKENMNEVFERYILQKAGV